MEQKVTSIATAKRGRPRKPKPEPKLNLPQPEPKPFSQLIDPTVPATFHDFKIGSGVSLPYENLSRSELADRTKYSRGPLDKYLKSLNLDELKFAVARDDSPRALAFLSALSDPENFAADITLLALEHRISMAELMNIWRSHKLTAAMGNLFDGAPEVAADTIADAKGRNICCPRCDGAGIIQIPKRMEGGVQQVWVDCVNCEGVGTVRKAGDVKSREWVFRATGLVKADSGNHVTIVNQAHAVDSVIDELERMDVVDITPKGGQ